MATTAQNTMLTMLQTQKAETPTPPTTATTNTSAVTITPQTLKENLHKLTAEDIQTMISMLSEQATQIALENEDLEALTEKAFETMFNRQGVAHEPEIHNGLLICAGSHRKNSTNSPTHACEFVCVNQQWVWTNPDHVSDEMRRIPINNKQHLRVITIIPINEGDTVDYVAQTHSGQGHKPKRKISYIVKNGQLEVTNTRETPRMPSNF